MTVEEAARSREVRPKVRAVLSEPPPADLMERIERLYAAAREGDREAVLARLREVVPGFTPSAVAARTGVSPSGSR
jgi:hypothetical protein